MRLRTVCLTLLLLMPIFSMVAVDRSNAYEIIDHSMYKDFHKRKSADECGGYQWCESDPSRTFALDDRHVYLVIYFQLYRTDFPFRGITAEWRDPAGKLIHGSDWDPVTGDPGEWKYWDDIEVKGKSRPVGLYTVKVYKGTEELFTEYFGIGHYPIFLNAQGLPETASANYSVDGVERGQITSSRQSVISFPISEQHAISVQETLEISAQERVRCTECDELVSGEKTVTFSFETEYLVRISTEPEAARSADLPSEKWYAKGSLLTLTVPQTVNGTEGVLYVFRGWRVRDEETADLRIYVNGPITTYALYGTQFHLTVSSSFGSPTGAGWYDNGTEASFSLNPSPVAMEGPFGALGGKYVFDHWAGDSAATTPTASIIMDGPKTVRAEWHADNTMPYILIGAIGAGVAVSLLLVLRRRVSAPSKVGYKPSSGVTEAATVYSAKDTIEPSRENLSRVTLAATSVSDLEGQKLLDMLDRLEKSHENGMVSDETYRSLREDYTRRLTELRLPVTEVPSAKFCTNCGAALPTHAVFCNKCGSKQ